jgi:flagellar biosynthesis GTPase FlhF
VIFFGLFLNHNGRNPTGKEEPFVREMSDSLADAVGKTVEKVVDPVQTVQRRNGLVDLLIVGGLLGSVIVLMLRVSALEEEVNRTKQMVLSRRVEKPRPPPRQPSSQKREEREEEETQEEREKEEEKKEEEDEEEDDEEEEAPPPPDGEDVVVMEENVESE